MLDNISGEILAIASYPSYNPNSPKRQITRNRALVDAFEPGSIIKPLALAKGIDMGIVSSNQVIDTSPGFINLRVKKSLIQKIIIILQLMKLLQNQAKLELQS